MTFIFCLSVQDNSAQMPVNINLSNLNMSEDMEDEEPLLEDEEEEEFLVPDVCSFSLIFM